MMNSLYRARRLAVVSVGLLSAYSVADARADEPRPAPERFHRGRLSLSAAGGLTVASAATPDGLVGVGLRYWLLEPLAIGIEGSVYPFAPAAGQWPSCEALWSANAVVQSHRSMRREGFPSISISRVGLAQSRRAP